MNIGRHMRALWPAATIGVAALAVAAVALAGQPRDAAAPQSEAATLEGDVGVLWALQQLGITKDQCEAAAKALDNYAAAREQSRASVESLLAGSANLLRSAREKLVMGEQPDADSLSALLKLRQDVRKARGEAAKARLAASETLSGLLTDEQKRKLSAGALGPAQAAARKTSDPAEALRVIRQWSDDEFAAESDALARRLAGKGATEQELAEVKTLLSEARGLSAEQFDAQAGEISRRFAEMPGLRGRAGDTRGPAGQRALVGIVAWIRRMPQDRYDRAKDAIIGRLQGANAAADEGARAALGSLLDEIRQVPEAELRTKLPDLGRRLADAAQAAGVDLSNTRVRVLAGQAAGAEGKDRMRVGMEFVTTLMSQNPAHVAQLLREYSGNMADGR